jgi:D-alanyl-lipoteichoic acid acyltransferase DltB (MBOAT superfamily)
VAFFPQLVAGPIERATNLLPQLLKRHSFDYDRVTDGLKLMLWGFIQKMVIADRLAKLADYVYADPGRHSGPVLLLATVFFAFQILCDFAGYSNIAIGAAQVLGIRLMVNFRRPYFATSILDFWRRWHISLSSWFRDYLYIPLGGNRSGVPRWCLSIFVVFLLSGLWHGANWTFLVWGGLHAGYMLTGRFTADLRTGMAHYLGLGNAPRLSAALRMLCTFGLVCFAWIFFRAQNLHDAMLVVKGLSGGWSIPHIAAIVGDTQTYLGLWTRDFWIALGLITGLLGINAVQSRGSIRARLSQQPAWVRWSAYSAGLWVLFLFAVLQHKEFYYFVF